jgi:hypothetical protein
MKEGIEPEEKMKWKERGIPLIAIAIVLYYIS